MDPPRQDVFRGREIVTSHLISTLPGPDGTVEILTFGRRIGLRAEWLQAAGTHREHFDLMGGRCDAAVRAGAVVDRRALGFALSEKKNMHVGQLGLFAPSASSGPPAATPTGAGYCPPDGATPPSGGPSSPTRWVVCPARSTGSMDAEDVDPEGWLDIARAMLAREQIEVCLYRIEHGGAWTLRGRLGTDGVAR